MDPVIFGCWLVICRLFIYNNPLQISVKLEQFVGQPCTVMHHTVEKSSVGNTWCHLPTRFTPSSRKVSCLLVRLSVPPARLMWYVAVIPILSLLVTAQWTKGTKYVCPEVWMLPSDLHTFIFCRMMLCKCSLCRHAVSVCLSVSVRLSRSWTLPKWILYLQKFFTVG